MKKQITIPEEVSNYIEALDYSTESLRELLLDAAERGIQGTEAYDRWEQMYTDSYAEFQVAKAQFEKDYVAPFRDGSRVNWRLDYNTSTLTLTEVEE